MICDYYIHKTDLADLSSLKHFFEFFVVRFFYLIIDPYIQYSSSIGDLVLRLDNTSQGLHHATPVFWQYKIGYL